VLKVETALRRVAVKERKAQQAAAATQATEAWLESDAAAATPWGGGRRLSRKEDPLRKGDPTQRREVKEIEEIWKETPDCKAFAALEPGQQSWCDDNCNAGFCPVDTCACDLKASARKQRDLARGVADGMSPEAAIKVERVKVDMESKGDANFPFDKAIIGYWGDPNPNPNPLPNPNPNPNPN